MKLKLFRDDKARIRLVLTSIHHWTQDMDGLQARQIFCPSSWELTVLTHPHRLFNCFGDQINTITVHYNFCMTQVLKSLELLSSCHFNVSGKINYITVSLLLPLPQRQNHVNGYFNRPFYKVVTFGKGKHYICEFVFLGVWIYSF